MRHQARICSSVLLSSVLCSALLTIPATGAGAGHRHSINAQPGRGGDADLVPTSRDDADPTDEVYRAATAKASGKLATQLRAEQRGWVKGRNDC